MDDLELYYNECILRDDKGVPFAETIAAEREVVRGSSGYAVWLLHRKAGIFWKVLLGPFTRRTS